MKWFMALAGLVMMVGINPGNATAAVDGAKWRAFVNQTLEGVVGRVEADGRTPVSQQKFVRRYDADGDGFIDRKESKVIQDFLASEKAAAGTGAMARKEVVADKPMAENTEQKKKYGW
ncbi:MAG: hypothetical protein Q8R76_09170 [Candidatus Omnitrophota bacterium]|nr:hypothetical protein [Candidatus Omnitrophota bacterium]